MIHFDRFLGGQRVILFLRVKKLYMNKLLILFLLTFSVIVKGQSIDTYVISSTGDALMNENGSLYFTVGEPFNTEISNGEIMVSQGFLQITIKEGSTSSSELLDESFKIYPNPTNGHVSIEKLGSNGGTYHFDLINSKGQKVSSLKTNSNFTNLDLSTLTSGLYFIQVHSEKEWLGTYQIIKN